MKTRVEKFAEDYADNWTGGFRHIAYKAYLNGYNQCIEDDIEQDMDEWQEKLSASYSLLKEQHWNMKCAMKALREEIYQLKNPSHEEKMQKYLELKEEITKKEVFY